MAVGPDRDEIEEAGGLIDRLKDLRQRERDNVSFYPKVRGHIEEIAAKLDELSVNPG